MKYRIVIDKPAQKFIERQPRKQQERILSAIAGLPFNGDTKPLKGLQNVFRLRVGTYRIIYSVYNDILTVYVMDAGNRGDIYK